MSYRNHKIDLKCRRVHWFLYDRNINLSPAKRVFVGKDTLTLKLNFSAARHSRVLIKLTLNMFHTFF